MSEPERCWKCDARQDVDAKGRVEQHDRSTVSSFVSGVRTRTGWVHCDGSLRPSKEEMARRKADRDLAVLLEIEAVRMEAAVALDAMIEGRAEYADRIARWQWLALWSYRQRWNVPAVHPFRYETKCAPSNRRAETRGDVYCRFCGERLLVGVKKPQETVAASTFASRHLATCALHVLVGLREMASPKHKALPFEQIVGPPTADSGPLFATAKP